MEKIFRIKEKSTDNKELTDVEIYTIWKNNFKKINNYVLNYLEQKKSKKDEKIQSDIKRKRK